MKTQKAMEKSYRKLAAGFLGATVALDSLAGVLKTEAFKVLYGGGQKREGHATIQGALDALWSDQGPAEFMDDRSVCAGKQEGLTPQGHATLKRFGVTLVE